MNMTLVLVCVECCVPARTLVCPLYKLKVRLELSRAKHPSLRGHARMARWLAALVPFYEYDEARVLPLGRRARRGRASGAAPASCALAELYRAALRRDARSSPSEVEPGISDLQFTAAYRVPFQYSRFVRQHLRGGRVRTGRRRASR